MFKNSCFFLLVVGILLGMPTLARAQANAAITGVVTDSTGGVLPGVTVEVSSPALIEGSRVAVTDGSGRLIKWYVQYSF